MKKTRYRTALDWYSHLDFSAYADFIPRKGEEIYLDVHEKYCNHNKIPLRLKVASVSYTSMGAIVELWYCDMDIDLAKLDSTGAKWNHLMKQ